MIEVLVIDDDEKICLFFTKLLARMGHQCHKAHTLEQARSLFHSHACDLVLLDLELPDGNGLDLLPEFTASDAAPEIIIITGTGDARGARLAFKYGAWDYIQKPFLLDEVGDLPLNAQKSLLRSLQERCIRPVGGGREISVNIRLIAATNLDLDQMVADRTFRKDLLYRIRAMEIHLQSGQPNR